MAATSKEQSFRLNFFDNNTVEKFQDFVNELKRRQEQEKSGIQSFGKLFKKDGEFYFTGKDGNQAGRRLFGLFNVLNKPLLSAEFNEEADDLTVKHNPIKTTIETYDQDYYPHNLS